MGRTLILCGSTCGHNHDSVNGPTGCCPDHGPYLYYCPDPHPPKETQPVPEPIDLAAHVAARATAALNGEPDPTVQGPPCSKCGHPMPTLSPELAAIARSNPGVVLAHEVCPGEKRPAEEGRYFEVRVQVVEVTEMEHDDAVSPAPEVVVEELISFRAGHRAVDLDAAMRPLALKLGEKWQKAEKQAKVADS